MAVLEDVSRNPYGYVPTKSVTIIFLALFSLSTLCHTGQSVYFRMWWLFPTAVLCGVMEILGWAARLWSSISPGTDTPFTIQITATILAPTPLVAANFIILGRIITRLGPHYSRLSPKWYAIIFCSCDVFALVVQGVGGGLASSASSSGKDPTLGGHIVLAGIIFQTIMITIYVCCAIEFFVRYAKDIPARSIPIDDATVSRGYMNQHLRLMSVALMFSTTCLFIRAIYRTVELADGWDGRVITTQIYFNILDGAMIVLSMYTLNIIHPGIFLDSSRSRGVADVIPLIENVKTRNTMGLS